MNWNKIFFYLAFAGWSLGLMVHVATIFNYDVSDNFPFIWLLHLGIFFVWIPMILKLRQNNEYREYHNSGSRNPLALLKLAAKSRPLWILIIAIAGFYYAFFNFIYFATSSQGSTAFENGHYILHNHGQFIRNITEAEYHRLEAATIRGFSGHWLAFYGIAAAYFSPFRKNTSSNL